MINLLKQMAYNSYQMEGNLWLNVKEKYEAIAYINFLKYFVLCILIDFNIPYWFSKINPN